MSIADDLEKLQQLRASGALSAEEFEQAKQKLLAGNGPVRTIPQGGPLNQLFVENSESLGTAANRYVSFQMIMGIIGLIIFLIMFFTVFLPMFSRGPSFSPGPMSFPK